jgi:DNA processing protein
MTYAEDVYPDSLRAINDPPVLLYYRGHLPDFKNEFYVSGVGTRRLSDYGRKNAFRIGYDLARAGAIFVSGMAEGIDGVAMAGALAAGGKTVAVIGTGIDTCYPECHITLAREIVKQGCVLTEYAPGTKVYKSNFPKRNRIISGLSSATIVFEGPERSGALITARCAREQGRAVYALPGNVGSKNSYAPNLLIKEGAKICTRAEDILNDFTDKYPSRINIFNLKDRLDVDMMNILHDLRVSATCPDDDIFSIPRDFTKKKSIFSKPVEKVVEETVSKEPDDSFDKGALALYKRIPSDGSCSIESLVNDDMPLRIVMRHLLKLEVGGFIVMLPGESVARKFK